MLMIEHEGKQLLRSWGLEVPAGTVMTSPAELRGSLAAVPAAFPVAVKAQVAGGGRGKAGGVVRVENTAGLAEAVARLFDTSFGGEKPAAVLIEPWLQAERELYLSVTIDSRAEGLVVLYAPHGGIEIESGPPPVRYPLGRAADFRVHGLRQVLEAAEADYEVRERVITIAQRLVRAAAGHDCTTVEINPLATLPDGKLVALDAKIVRDEWAAFRHRDIHDARKKFVAAQPGLLRACLEMQHMYVPLDGDVGLISGGAGMTMAAMDMIEESGGKPACFLDCSPGPTSTRGYRPAFAMLDADPGVKVILVSVFGGGTQMQRVANAMREIAKERTSTKPVVYRLDGTNVDQVPAILAEIGAVNHDCLEEAVAEAVRLAACGT
jgi:succinyl-CoA synthetase beta subunit